MNHKIFKNVQIAKHDSAYSSYITIKQPITQFLAVWYHFKNPKPNEAIIYMHLTKYIVFSSFEHQQKSSDHNYVML